MSSAGLSPRPDGPANGIVEIRRKVASGVLDSLQTALDIIAQQAQRIQELQSAIIQGKSALAKDRNAIDRASELLGGDLRAVRTTVRAVYGDSEGNIDEEVDGAVQKAEEHLQQLNHALRNARETANRLIAHYYHVDSIKLNERKEKFEREGRNALARAGQSDPLKELKSIWEEGLDLLSGLCLRSEGLDRGLCKFADAIIAETRWNSLKPMTVPGRGGPGHLTSIVHLRFPEWTIWALPLTAHELWHLGVRSAVRTIPGAIARQSNDVLDLLLDTVRSQDPGAEEKLRDSKQIWNTEELQRCLADVFGVYVMGPAYACAAIWLVLDPQEAESRQRALGILRALGTGPNNEYAVVHGVLESQWRQATKDSGTTELKYADWVDALLKYLEGNAAQFRIDRWGEIRQPWFEVLLNGKIDTLKVNSNDLRYALTAAWKARIEQPDQASVIAENCLKLCEKIITLRPASILPGQL